MLVVITLIFNNNLIQDNVKFQVLIYINHLPIIGTSNDNLNVHHNLKCNPNNAYIQDQIQTTLLKRDLI